MSLGEWMVVNVDWRGCGGGRSAEGDMEGAGGGELAGAAVLLVLAVSSASGPLVLEAMCRRQWVESKQTS